MNNTSMHLHQRFLKRNIRKGSGLRNSLIMMEGEQGVEWCRRPRDASSSAGEQYNGVREFSPY